MPRTTLLDGPGAGDHYDPNQPRDWHGRWTDTGSENPPPTAPAEFNRPPAHSPTQPGVAMSRKCRKEWDYASDKCNSLRNAGKLTRYSGYGSNLDKCILGMVSFACGGNPYG